MVRRRFSIAAFVLGLLILGGYGIYSYATSLHVESCFPPAPPRTFERLDVSEETIQDLYRGRLQPKAGQSYEVELKITDRRVVEKQTEKVFVLDGKITYFQHPTLNYETDFRINLTDEGSVQLTQLGFPAFEFRTPTYFFGTLEAGESTGRFLLNSDDWTELTLHGVKNPVKPEARPHAKPEATIPTGPAEPCRETSPRHDSIRVTR